MRSCLVKWALPLLLLLTGSTFGYGSPSPTDICEVLSFPPQGSSTPPAIKPADQSVRVLAFGDFGDGGSAQDKVAKAMLEYHQNPDHPFDFGITLGDNFYNDGMHTPTLPEWESHWEKPYGALKIRIYASLGNHDHYNPTSPIAEALYSRITPSKTWCLPRTYYTYTAGPVQFFVLDTDSIIRSKKGGHARPLSIQKAWLSKQLKASKSVWKVVYGHHPIYSTGQHGDSKEMKDEIFPILKENKVDTYIAGHEHDMQALKPEGGVYFFISGAGGHHARPLGQDSERRLWAKGNVYGFSVLEADAQSLSVSFFDTKSSQLCKVKLIKNQNPAVDCP